MSKKIQVKTMEDLHREVQDRKDEDLLKRFEELMIQGNRIAIIRLLKEAGISVRD
jgi:hypothetical protein